MISAIKNIFCTLLLATYSMLSIADGLLGGGNYTPGVANIRDMAVPREAGFIYEQYNVYYTAESFTDADGNDISNRGGSLNSFAIAPTFIWTTDEHLLGARYAFYISPSLVSNETNGADTSGVGDLFIQPLWLGWQEEAYDINLGVGLYAPIGAEDVTYGMWTTQVQLAGYYYVMQGAGAILLSSTYELHGKSDNTGTTPGDHLTLEYGYSHYLTSQFELGVHGYSQIQVESDDLTNIQDGFNGRFNTSLGDKSEVHALGGSAGYWIDSHWNITANASKEYSSKARFEGNMYSVNIIYSPKAIF